MTDQNMTFILDIVLRYLSIIAGIITIFLGYRVFVKSTNKSNELSAKQIVPTIIFALLGTLIILATILQDTFSNKPVPLKESELNLSKEVAQIRKDVSTLNETIQQNSPKQQPLQETPQKSSAQRADLLAIKENMRQSLGLNDSIKMPPTIAKNDSLLKGFLTDLDSTTKKER